MKLRTYKFVVKAVPQIVDDEGEVVGEEQNVQPVELIGVKGLVAWAQEFPVKLAEAEAEANASRPPAAPNRAARRAKKPKPA